MKPAAALLSALLSCAVIACSPNEQPVQQQTPASQNEIVAPAPASAPAPTKPVDPVALYQPCITCHGDKGEKQAFDSSRPLSTMSEEEIVHALKGYQQGNYGSSEWKETMKLMVGMHDFNEEEILALAHYIASLNQPATQ
ncbi:MAG: c-type cytochrome [Neisseria sp.]|nr:c-type cytochrome [Neisseria sp.]